MNTILPPANDPIGVSRPDQAGNGLLSALGTRSMARNTVWNVVGQLLPMALAAVTIPLLIKQLGIDRFGVLTLAWAVVGYFGLFDFGLGRALTKAVSEDLARGKNIEAASAIWTTALGLTLLGSLFAVALLLASHRLIYGVLKVPVALRQESLRAVYWLSLSIPVVTVTVAFRGVLEAQHRFGMVNVVRVCMGAFSYLGPLLAALYSADIALLCSVLVIGRAIAALLHILLCLHTLPDLRRARFFDRNVLSGLLNTGMWITVSNTVGPILTYVERFMLGAFLSVAAVAYYATPSELATRVLLVPGSITAVLFPAFAALSVIDSERLQLTYDRGVRACFALVFPVIFVMVLFAPEGLGLWLGPVFAAKSTVVLRWVAMGILVNSLAQVPYALLQAGGRADLPGKLHLIETPLYLGVLALSIKIYGVPGAAAVWALRLMIEGLILLLMAHRTLVPGSMRTALVLLIGSVTIIIMSVFLGPLWLKLLWGATVLSSGGAIFWRYVLRGDERTHFSTLLSGWTGGKA